MGGRRAKRHATTATTAAASRIRIRESGWVIGNIGIAMRRAMLRYASATVLVALPRRRRRAAPEPVAEIFAGAKYRGSREAAAETLSRYPRGILFRMTIQVSAKAAPRDPMRNVDP